jgi:hypothetical protein
MRMVEKGLFIFLVFILVSACGKAAQAVQNGYLEGIVSVGPLSPVERVPEPGQSATQISPEVFTSRSILIFKQDGKTLVSTIHLKGDGTYQVELAPGQYFVTLPNKGIEHSKDLPAKVQIRAGEHTRLDIDIDTGFR